MLKREIKSAFGSQPFTVIFLDPFPEVFVSAEQNQPEAVQAFPLLQALRPVPVTHRWALWLKTH